MDSTPDHHLVEVRTADGKVDWVNVPYFAGEPDGPEGSEPEPAEPDDVPETDDPLDDVV